jgi:hypothetical protein
MADPDRHLLLAASIRSSYDVQRDPAGPGVTDAGPGAGHRDRASEAGPDPAAAARPCGRRVHTAGGRIRVSAFPPSGQLCSIVMATSDIG